MASRTVRLNLNVAGLRPSATVAINDRSNELRAQGRAIVKLGLGQSPFPVPEPVVEALRRHAHEKDYLPARGLPALREAVARHHERTFGIQADPQDVFIGPGSKELMFLLQLCHDGDLVVPSPSWVSYIPQARIVDRPIVSLNTTFESRWSLAAADFAALGRAESRDRLFILTYPNNPTGLGLGADEVADLAAAAREAESILLSDEIYAKIRFDGEHHSALPHYPEGTIFSGGLSKWCGAGGWRLGVFVFPPELRELRDAITSVATETFTSTSAPIQHAAVAAFDGGPEIDAYLADSKRVLRALAHAVTSRFEAIGARVHRPEGGFYVFPDLGTVDSDRVRSFATSAALCEAALEATGVAFLPGSDFGRPADELTVRLAFVDFEGAAALEAAAATPAGTELGEGFCHDHGRPVIDGVDRLCDWLLG